jgi:hypothetical protein
MTFLLAFTRTWKPVLALGLLWSAPMLPAMRGWPTAAIVAALAGVTWYGHRKSLRTFPWRRNEIGDPEAMRFKGRKSILEQEIRIDGLGNSQAVGTTSMGWPFQWLSPKIEAKSIANSTSFAVSALIGWWTYCVMVATEAPLSPGMLLFFSVGAALLRLSMYCSGVGPPFNIWGRIASGRIIVPGFDRVFLTPVVVVALAIVGGMAIRRAGSWQTGASACVVTVVCFAVISGGPKMQTWLLTGQHRCGPPRRMGTTKQLLKPI